MPSQSNKRLNIAYLDFDDITNPLLGAGQARATFEVAKCLIKRGHEVTVYSSKFPGYIDRTEEGIRYIHFGFSSKYIRLNNLLYFFFIPFIVPKIKADIIIESFTAPFSTLCSPLFTKIPVVGLPSMFNAKEFAKKYYLPFHWIEFWGSRCYKYFLPYSDIDSAKMKKLNPNIQYKIVPQGVDQSFFEIEHKTPKHILFLSRLDINQKGLDLLVKSYAKIKDQIKYPLVIAGHGPDESKIKKMVKDFGLESYVTFAGSAYGEKKSNLISEAIYVAFPSRHDELSLWSLEALASGMPLVSFDLPECSWCPETCNLKAKPFDLDQYSKLLLKATDPELNAQMRINARNHARKYTWESVAEQFEAFFFEIIDQSK